LVDGAALCGDRVKGAPGRVSRPRHFLLYCSTRPDGQVEIGRVLHDSMDLQRHLPDEYRADSQDE
jgi:toxin ParE1/3/4